MLFGFYCAISNTKLFFCLKMYFGVPECCIWKCDENDYRDESCHPTDTVKLNLVKCAPCSWLNLVNSIAS
jgi:hypothetical protein